MRIVILRLTRSYLQNKSKLILKILKFRNRKKPIAEFFIFGSFLISEKNSYGGASVRNAFYGNRGV